MMWKALAIAPLYSLSEAYLSSKRPIVPSPSKIERMDDVNVCFENSDRLRVFHPNNPSLEDRTLGIQDLFVKNSKPHKVYLKCAGKPGPTAFSRAYICMHHITKNYYYFKDNSPKKDEFEDCPPCVYEKDIEIQCGDGFTLASFDASHHVCASVCGDNQYWMDSGCYCNHGYEWNAMATDCVPSMDDGDFCTGAWEELVMDNCQCAMGYHWYMNTGGTHCVLDEDDGSGMMMF